MVIIAAIVIGAGGGEVLRIGPPAAGPTEDVVNLALIGGLIASLDRAGGIFRRGHHELLPGGPTAHAVQVHWALYGVEQGDKSLLGKRTLGQFSTRDLRAIGHGQHHIVAAMGHADQLIQWHHNVGAHGCGGAGTGAEEGGDVGKRTGMLV